MHPIEIPHAPPSLKLFGIQYSMIVLGILTALGLEECVVSSHRKHAAETAQHEIEAELRANVLEIRDARQRNDVRIKSLTALSEGLIREIKAGTPNETIQERLVPSKDSLKLGMTTPTLRREAWDVAVANQAAAHIDATTLRKYSAAYAAQREVAANAVPTFALLFNGTRQNDVITDYETGHFVPRDILQVVRQGLGAVQNTQQQLTNLEHEVEAALPEPVKDAPANAAPSATPPAAAR